MGLLELGSLVKCKHDWQYERTYFFAFAHNKVADQPEHPHSLICPFAILYLNRIISSVSIYKISQFTSVAELACSLMLKYTENI